MKGAARLAPFLKVSEQSQTLLINEQSRNMEQAGQRVIKFGFGQSPFPPFAPAVEALKSFAGSKEYTPVQGTQELRTAVASFHHKVDGIAWKPENVLVAPGSKILLLNLMLAFDKMTVMVPSPAWVSYAPQARLCKHECVRVESSFGERWRVTPESVDAAAAKATDKDAPKLLILNHPGNPEGLAYTEDELRALAATFEKHNILVISDEIYGLLNHSGSHKSLARFYPDMTIVTTGLSKWCGAGGWRLGVALLPPALDAVKSVYIGVASESYSCAPAPVQHAAVTAYTYTPDLELYLKQQRRFLGQIGVLAAERLAAAGIRVHKPEGAFYLFVDFSAFDEAIKKMGVTTAAEFFTAVLKETGVALLSGECFGIPASTFAARLAYVTFDGAKVLSEGAKVPLDERLPSEFLAEHAPDVLEGVDRLVKFTAKLI